MVCPIDTSQMYELNNLSEYDPDPEFVDQTLQLSKDAISYLESHKWCKKVKNILFDRGFGYPLGVFFVEFEPKGIDDNFVWVIVGDIPLAYMDVSCKNGADALDAYVFCMNEWVENVFQGKSVEELIPVNVPPEEQYAKMLRSRLDFIKEYLKNFEDELKAD